MDQSIEALEGRIDEVRGELRRAAVGGDQDLVAELRAELRELEAAWDRALTRIVPGDAGRTLPGGSLVPLREQVHHALTLLTVPAAPRLIVAIHAAFFGATIPSARLTSLRRDEERSFQSAPFARPYYICPALTADRLAPARGLLSISTWSVADRVVGPLSPRVHFLTSAIKVAEAVSRTPEPRPEARRLLVRFAANIPGGEEGGGTPESLIAAARDELVIHEEADRTTREAAARRARRLDDVSRLFGVRLGPVSTVEDAG